MKLQMIFIIVAALMLGACGKQSKNNSTRINRYTGGQLTSGTTTCNTQTWGRIYDSSVSEAVFSQRMADFSFKDAAAGDIGTVNPTTGLEFQMTLNFVNGMLTTAGSTAAFRITDSYTTTQNLGYIHFSEFSGAGGQGANGQFNAQVGDQKGYVRFEGYRSTYQGQQVVYGRAYYNNNNQGEQYLGEFINGSCSVVGI